MLIMNLKPFFQEIEIRFWNFAIPWMENSTWFKRVMPWAYQTISAHRTKKAILVLGGCIAAGGSLGFLLGLLSKLH
jgi:hypothetical protein